MNFIVKLFFPAVLLFFSNSNLHPIPWIEFNNKTPSFSENKNKYFDSQIQYYNTSPIDNSSFINHYVFAKMNDHDFAKFFLNYGEKDILPQHELYIYPAFITYLKTLNGYKNYIIALSHAIKTNKRIRKQTAFVSGFYFETNIFCKLKSGFHDFIHNEAAKILVDLQQPKTKSTKRGALKINRNELRDLIEDYSRNQVASHSHMSSQIDERINAINLTLSQNGICSDYRNRVIRVGKSDKYPKEFSNTYGTELDYQLHKELCDIRQQVFDVEYKYYANYHVKTIAPSIHYYAAQAKKEENVRAAFQLSDFCHMLTQILSQGMNILYECSHSTAKGIIKGVKIFATIDHWKDMARGAIQLVLCFADAIGQEESLHYSLALARSSSDPDALSRFYKEYHLHAKAEADAIDACIKQTYHKIRSMSWQEIIENGSEIGTTMILDTLALNALSGFTRATSKAFIQELKHGMENGVLLTEEYTVEVAGFGKMVVEEGVEIGEITNEFITKLNSKEILKASNSKQMFTRYVTEDLRDVIKNCEDHIFSPDHKLKGILKLGKDQQSIMDSLYDVIASINEQCLLKEGPNQIRAEINGINNVEIKCFIKNGEILSVNAYISNFNRIYGNFINWTQKV